ncbi:hypothetical protein BBJ28_00001646 [Nothophytophthora sp. Chile5]|nr:hypothetical protein BBJ28_00001646 [Nothophytophthora sp. Chile5]
MMEMQDVKERRPHSLRSADPAEDALETETDPMVPPDAPSLQSRRRSTPESWLRFVFDRIWAVAFLAAASLGLYEADFFREVLHSPLANRGFVHLGVLFASLLVLFGGYIEVYRSMVLGEQVSYATARTATHGMLVSMAASGLW